jgi:hypothetical protein
MPHKFLRALSYRTRATRLRPQTKGRPDEGGPAFQDDEDNFHRPTPIEKAEIIMATLTPPPSASQGQRLTLIRIIERRDGSIAIVRRPDGTYAFGPLRAEPKPPRKHMIECCCCGRWLVVSEFEDGTVRVEPLSKPLAGDGGET